MFKKNMIPIIVVFACLLCLEASPTWAKSKSCYETISEKGYDLNNKNKVPSSVQVHSLLDFEKAITQYQLAFQEYQQAKHSTDLSERAKLPQLLKAYREAYAKALKLMRDDDLIHPMFPAHPLRNYETAFKNQFGKSAALKKEDFVKVREVIAKGVKENKPSSEILDDIAAKDPKGSITEVSKETAPLVASSSEDSKERIDLSSLLPDNTVSDNSNEAPAAEESPSTTQPPSSDETIAADSATTQPPSSDETITADSGNSGGEGAPGDATAEDGSSALSNPDSDSGAKTSRGDLKSHERTNSSGEKLSTGDVKPAEEL